MTDRIIAIGDIHGCAKALATLLEAIQPSQQDTLVFLGDYIDRGPDSRGVLEQVVALTERCSVVPLLGNHEEMLLAALEGGQSEARMTSTCSALVRAGQVGQGFLTAEMLRTMRYRRELLDRR